MPEQVSPFWSFRLVHYHHGHHAGNFADVFKHVALYGLLAALNRKDRPWCYLETHAGAGLYDLNSPGAVRTGEWRDGIGRFCDSGTLVQGQRSEKVPALLVDFLEGVAAMNPGGALSRYPGSPEVARSLARSDDRLVLCEKVAAVAGDLRQQFAGDRRVIVHVRDGYEAHSLLPPAERRGLVLVDPPFERADEFEAVADFLRRALARFAGGVYAVWYPLKNRHAAARFERRAAVLATRSPLCLTLDTGAVGAGQLRACALLILNAPFGFAQAFDPVGHWLARTLAQGPRAAYTVRHVSTAVPDRAQAPSSP